MAKLLLNLHRVFDGEIEDVRSMLETNGIAFYETKPSRWGVSHGGIWLKEAADYTQAKTLMAEYQANRQQRVRAERESAIREGTAETFRTVLRQRPLQVVWAFVAIIFLLRLVALPVVLLHQ